MNTKPTKIVVPLSEGLAWNRPNCQVSQKMDGRFGVRDVAGCVLAGELMAEGGFWAFDLLASGGADMRMEPLRARWGMLRQLGAKLDAARIKLVPSASGAFGGAFLDKVLTDGGEGAILKRWEAPYGENMTACKRVQDFICRVSSIGPGQSAALCDSLTGQPCGRVSLFGGRADRVRVGSVVKINGLGVTEKGMIRDPRPDKDTETSWLIQF